MSLILWDESLGVNVKEIDTQHQKLIDLINELHDAMKGGKGKEVLQEILNGLADYTVYHFNTEEKYFAEFHYDKSVEHKGQHKEFVEKVVEFKKKFEADEVGLTIEIMHFLKDWTVEHIKGSDKEFTKCFNEHGLY